MRKLLAFLALSLTLVVVAATAQAQRFGGGGFQQSGYQLLNNKSVQEELKMTDDQKSKVKEVVDKIQAEAKEKGFGGGGFKNFKDATQEEKDKMMAKAREAAKETNDKAMKELAPLMKEEQLKRLKQIERQQQRLALFADADFGKEIGLTDEQKTKIKSIADEAAKDAGEIRTAMFNKEMDFKDGQKKIDAVNKDGMEKAVELLKDDQKAKYKEAVGAPFELVQQFGGGGGFGKNKKQADKDK